MAYNLYEPTKQGSFEQLLIDGERQLSSANLPNQSKDLLLVDSLDLLYRRGKGIHSHFQMDWPAVWESFWRFKFDDAYAKDRGQLTHRLRKVDTSKSMWDNERWELYQIEEWDRFFDRLSKELKFIHFELNPKDRRFVNMMTIFPKRTKTFFEVIKNMSYVGAAVSEYVHPGLAVPTLVMGGVSGILMAGQGISSTMSSARAAAGFELGADVVRARTGFRK